MLLIDDLRQANLQTDTVITVGAFDGVHRGHQYLIRNLIRRARETGRLAGLVTFHPHPVAVLQPHANIHYLTTPGEKAALLEKLSLDVVAILPFDREMANTPARDFVQLLVERLRMRELWIGRDFALGRGREGNPETLAEMGKELGFEVRVVEPLLVDGEPISSTRIRRLLSAGDVREAARLLGRYPSIVGEVVTGAHRGHGLGFPTANLEVREEHAVPADGVYAVFAVLGRDRYPGVANIGVRPSFDNGLRTVETYIIGFDQDIYGCDLVVQFVERLRSEERFDNVEDLKAQIAQDVQAARAVLGAEPGGDAEQMGGTECHYRELPHTADLAIEVWGERFTDLLAHAAAAMFELQGIPQEQGEPVRRRVEVSSLDRGGLLVDWLSELLYLSETHGEIYTSFQFDHVTDTELSANVEGFAGRRTSLQIKAATFYDLRIIEEPDRWTARITFDI